MIERFRARAKLIRPLLVPLVLYLGFLILSFNWLETHTDSSWRNPMALLPMIPGVWIAIGVVRAIQKLDEMERYLINKVWENRCYKYVITALETISKLYERQIGKLV